jgi:signal peptide peptidase SppA
MPLDAITLPAVAGLELDQYCGVWAVEESRFNAQLSFVAGLDLRAHVAAQTGRDIAAVSQSQTAGGMAVIDIAGTLTKRGSSLSSAGSMVRLRQAVRAAASDPEVAGILLKIDSPGGTVAGTADLGDEIAAAKKRKPVYAFVEDLAASAAYWLAAQADKVYANTATADIGSIGVYMALYDMSRAAANEGVEAIVIRSTPLKGAGVPGAPVTDEQKAVWQELVDTAHAEFTAAVKRGRGMTKEQVAAVATGRVYRASEAQRLGLIDGIQSFDKTLAELARAAAERTKGRPRMSAASYAELLVACEGIDPKNKDHAAFICDQMNGEATAEAAGKAWTRRLLAEAASARQAAEAARQEAETAKATRTVPGVEALTETAKGKATASEGYSGDAATDFDIAVREKIRGGMPRQAAVLAVARTNPELYKGYLFATNPKRKSRSLIEDKFDQE